MNIKNTNSNHIQILRGLAIVAVVLIHNTPGGYSQVFIRPFLNFSVGMFLFLSGMLSDAQNWKPAKRVKKVIIPYVIWTFIYVVLDNCYAPASIPRTYVKSLITANAAAMLYYIYVYCEFTVLIPLIDKLARSRFRYLGFLITPLEVIFVRMIPLVTQWYTLPGWVSILRDISCAGWFTYYYLGYLLGNGLITVIPSYHKWAGLLVLSIPLQMLEAWWLLSKGFANSGTQMKLSAVFTGVCITILAYRFIRSDKPCRNRVLEVLGDHSFAIYFSHIAVMRLLEVLPQYTWMCLFPVNGALVIVINLILIILGKKIFGKYGKYLAL